jgi:hypothetical protein
MNIGFFIKRDIRDNKLFWLAPLVLFSMLFGVSHLWRMEHLSAVALRASLQVLTFLFIFISASLYGVYLNSVLGTSLHVKTQMSLTRNYLFSLPIKRSTLFFYNQVRLLLPLLPFVVLGVFYIITFNRPTFHINMWGIGAMGVCLSLLILSYFSWLSCLVERLFEHKSLIAAFKGFFIVNPVLLLIIYFLFGKNIGAMSTGSVSATLVAYLAPAMMIALNYINWQKRQ